MYSPPHKDTCPRDRKKEITRLKVDGRIFRFLKFSPSTFFYRYFLKRVNTAAFRLNDKKQLKIKKAINGVNTHKLKKKVFVSE